MLYVDSPRLARAVCRLGLAHLAALDYDLLGEAGGCGFRFVVVWGRLRPRDLLELREAGFEGVLYLFEEDGGMCPAAEALGMMCARAVVVSAPPARALRAMLSAAARAGGAVPLVKPSCGGLLGVSERCLRAYAEAAARVAGMVSAPALAPAARA